MSGCIYYFKSSTESAPPIPGLGEVCFPLSGPLGGGFWEKNYQKQPLQPLAGHGEEAHSPSACQLSSCVLRGAYTPQGRGKRQKEMPSPQIKSLPEQV